jgi:hypothetical protein
MLHDFCNEKEAKIPILPQLQKYNLTDSVQVIGVVVNSNFSGKEGNNIFLVQYTPFVLKMMSSKISNLV